MQNAKEKLLRDLNSPFKMRLYYLLRLPSILWFGIRIKNASAEKCAVTLPFTWRSKNPFQSIYFAAQCAAAELSTGIPALLAIEGRGRFSMLVVRFEIEFFKKATLLTTFECTDGQKIEQAVLDAIESGEGRTVIAETTGTQANGEVVSQARITWSFKPK